MKKKIGARLKTERGKGKIGRYRIEKNKVMQMIEGLRLVHCFFEIFFPSTYFNSGPWIIHVDKPKSPITRYSFNFS